MSKKSKGKLPEEAQRLQPTQLQAYCDPADFAFTTTDEIEPLGTGIIGQPRALRAMEFGLAAKHSGYHIFISGPSGTGKMTFAQAVARQVAEHEPAPQDICYVNHFAKPDQPRVLHFAAGQGTLFRNEVKKLIQDYQDGLRKVLGSKDYEAKRIEYLRRIEEQMNELLQEMEEIAAGEGFLLKKGANGFFPVPMGQDGKGLTKEEFEALDEATQKHIQMKESRLEGLLTDIARRSRQLQAVAGQWLRGFERQAATDTIDQQLQGLLEKYAEAPQVMEYLQALRDDVIEHLDDFKVIEEGESDEGATPLALLTKAQKASRVRYDVNVLVATVPDKGAPVIVENNPTYPHLFGKVDYRSLFGNWVTDFTMLKPGAVHLANGGYLIVPALALLSEPGAWDGLKRILKSGEIRIENLSDHLGLSLSASLKPEPVPVNVKVILHGSARIYHLLYALDEDFRKYFKVRVDFDEVMERNQETMAQYAGFIRSLAEREGLPAFTARGVARIIDESSRMVADQTKLSAHFDVIKGWVLEAAHWAPPGALVDAAHVDQAIWERRYRHDSSERRIREETLRGTLMIATEGQVIGQVNGLAVLDLNDYRFGKPSRITARSYLGREGVIHIERETQMSGQSHDKGILTLASFFAARFARERPVAFAATITFEQLYGGIDGDSASVAELCALMSAIGELPLRQDLAVTGSVNQHGEVQPIGGVNEKIEGFFRICQARGLTGQQGVIIPALNQPHLMLSREVIDAVRQGTFHVFSVTTADQAMALLTGLPPGKTGKNGQWSEGSFNRAVSDALERMHQAWQDVRRTNRIKGSGQRKDG
ncbi:Lon protease family protein [Heliophilum fasciatum]|uniref:endopeptidase La n=1 Tax=Heliophilum fasciatum TaxID=35700 RepID=A0A4R2RN99_9FIRM|nr:ATP-binding protein [Heliophilum fasciatum]MCW2278350.1 putative ATP-dependent protease [Heliophilum fasciatum]TCP63777.1 putative ATP-dependent protease [Heliophilum fasciatum]